jgi:hypothetical protein
VVLSEDWVAIDYWEEHDHVDLALEVGGDVLLEFFELLLLVKCCVVGCYVD